MSKFYIVDLALECGTESRVSLCATHLLERLRDWKLVKDHGSKYAYKCADCKQGK